MQSIHTPGQMWSSKMTCSEFELSKTITQLLVSYRDELYRNGPSHELADRVFGSWNELLIHLLEAPNSVALQELRDSLKSLRDTIRALANSDIEIFSDSEIPENAWISGEKIDGYCLTSIMKFNGRFHRQVWSKPVQASG